MVNVYHAMLHSMHLYSKVEPNRQPATVHNAFWTQHWLFNSLIYDYPSLYSRPISYFTLVEISKNNEIISS